jgi:hypothetical protein
MAQAVLRLTAQVLARLPMAGFCAPHPHSTHILRIRIKVHYKCRIIVILSKFFYRKNRNRSGWRPPTAQPPIWLYITLQIIIFTEEYIKINKVITSDIRITR